MVRPLRSKEMNPFRWGLQIIALFTSRSSSLQCVSTELVWAKFLSTNCRVCTKRRKGFSNETGVIWSMTDLGALDDKHFPRSPNDYQGPRNDRATIQIGIAIWTNAEQETITTEFPWSCGKPMAMTANLGRLRVIQLHDYMFLECPTTVRGLIGR